MANSVPITALTAEAVYGAINITITATTNPCLPYLQVASYQIWAATSNNRAVATQVGTSNVPFWPHTAATPGTTYWYWAKSVDSSGAVGDFYPTITTSTATATAKTSAGLTLTLSASAIVVPADATGAVTSFSGAVSTAKVMDGVTDATASWSFSAAATGVTVSQSTATFTLTAMASSNGYFDVTATRAGYPNLVARCTVAKSQIGATGSTGSRGSMTFYVSGQSVWSDSAANTAAGAAPGGKQLNDVVTEYNATNFSQTKFWNGTAWTTITQVIDGNLLVTGTVGTTQISATYVYAGDIDASQVTAGTFTGLTFRTAASGRRVEISGSNNEIRFYNSGGGWSASVGATSGGALVWAFVSSTDTTPAAYFSSSHATAAACHLQTSNSATALRAEVIGAGTVTAISATGRAASANSHAIRGQSDGSGLVGVSTAGGSYSFYAESAAQYGPFTGSHDGLLLKTATVEPGDIMVDVAVVGTATVSDVITEVARSTSPNQATAIGVFLSRRDMEGAAPNGLSEAYEAPMDKGGKEKLRRRSKKHDALVPVYDLVVLNSLGEGSISVCGEGGNIAPGDLIVTSSTPGKGMKAADGIVRNTTVAKAREPATFSGGNQVRLIACTYLCG